MRFRTPVSSTKKSDKGWSPPSSSKGIPVQQYRPNIQQARGEPILEVFTPTPEQPRYNIRNDMSPFILTNMPKYPSQELQDCGSTKKNGSKPISRLGSSKNALVVTQRPSATFRLFSFMVLTVASLHLFNLGNHSFAKHPSHTSKGAILDKKSYLMASRYHRGLMKGVKPRTFFMGDRVENNSPSFRPVIGRQVRIYPTGFSDVTQLYDQKGSDDKAIEGTMERKFFPMHETRGSECIPMSPWQKMSFPTCNILHEMSIDSSLQDTSLRLLSSAGSWRDAWRFKTLVEDSLNEKQILDNVIIKTIKFEHTLQDRYFEFSRVDALAMERLTSSPYIINIHGFCGVSVVTERGIDSITHVVKHISPRDKVDVARRVAKSIAAVHEIDGEDAPVALVHNDINDGNFFMGHKKNPLLNDFNIAVLMMKDRRTNETCSFPGHFPNAQWKSPEEQVGTDGNAIGELTEKVDIYALGNLFFRFATDKSPWREIADDSHAKLTSEQKASIAHAKVNEGKMPMVPDETLKLKNPYIDLLLEAMEMCYRFKPEERPTARQVAEFLEKRKKEVDQSLVEFGRYPKQMK